MRSRHAARNSVTWLTVAAVMSACFGDPGAPSPSEPAATPPPPPSSTATVLLVAGDIAECDNERDALTAKILDTTPGTILTAGDNAYPSGTAAEYAECYGPTWGRHRSRTYAALGDNDYGAGTADAAFTYFGKHVGPRGKGYYSLDLGAWHIIVLNDNDKHISFDAGSAQDLWLQQDLTSQRGSCTLVVHHQPRFFSSTAGTESESRRIIWERLYAAGADLVVSGHWHHYERLAPMAPGGTVDQRRGLRQFIVGTGGRSTRVPSVVHPSSEVRAATFGVLKLTLVANGYSWEFLPIEGESFRDAGSAGCH